MKHGLVLSGGGAKGAIEIGAIEVIMESGVTRFDAVSGISVGALIASFVAMDKLDIAKEIFVTPTATEGSAIFAPKLANIKDGKLVVDFTKILNILKKGVSIFDGVKALFGKKGKKSLGQEAADNLNTITGLLTSEPLHKLLTQHVKLQDFKTACFVSGVSLETAQEVKFNIADFYNDENAVNAILCSATMPVILEPVKEVRSTQGTFNHMVDGGINTISPFGMIFDFIQPDEDWTIWVINCNARQLPIDLNPKNIINVAGRSLDIMLNAIFNKDLKNTLFINDNADAVGKKKAIINVIEPKTGDSGNTLDFRKATIDYRIQLGRSLAKTAIKKWQLEI